jgi:hypothetical protein
MRGHDVRREMVGVDTATGYALDAAPRTAYDMPPMRMLLPRVGAKKQSGS